MKGEDTEDASARTQERAARVQTGQSPVGSLSSLFLRNRAAAVALQKMQKKMSAGVKIDLFLRKIYKTHFYTILRNFYVHIWNYMHIYFPKIVPSKGAHLVILFTIANVIKQLEIGESVQNRIGGRKMKGEQNDKVKSR